MPSEDWKTDSFRWRGRVLTGVHSHWCADWDYLPIDETCPEWPCACADELRAKRPAAEYTPSDPAELWWCNCHQRRATMMQIWPERRHCCDPKLSGIAMPCSCVELTGQVEIESGR